MYIIGGACRCKVTIKLQKQFATPKDAVEHFRRLEEPQPLERPQPQSATQFSQVSHPSATQPPTHPLPPQQEPPEMVQHQAALQVAEVPSLQTPSHLSATQPPMHPLSPQQEPPEMVRALNQELLQLHLQQLLASQRLPVSAQQQAPPPLHTLLQNLQLLRLDQPEEHAYSPLQVLRHDSLEDFERRFRSLPDEDQLKFLGELFSGYCTRNHGFHIPADYLELSIRGMLHLEKGGRSNILYGLASGLGSVREDGSSRFPVDRMPMGLLQYMVDFFNCHSIQQVSSLSHVSVCNHYICNYHLLLDNLPS